MEDVSDAGWNSLPALYAFRYQDTKGTDPPFYFKCLKISNIMVVHWTSCSAPVELEVDKYTTMDPLPPDCYQNIRELLKKLQNAGLGRQTSSLSAQEVKEGVAGKVATSQPVYLRHEEDYNVDFQPSTTLPGGGVGMRDSVPPGVRPPGYGPQVPFPPGGGVPERGGGMHVGPGDPIFGPGRHGPHPTEPAIGRGLPPGARWDPIAPEGLPGAHPDDFIPEARRRIHPDVMQPGPGRGTDWDNMFG